MKRSPLGPCRACKKNKLPAAVHINGCRNNSENPALRSPLLSARTPGPVPSSAPYMTPANPTVLDSESRNLELNSCSHCPVTVFHHCALFLCVSHSCLTSFTDVTMHRSSPRTLRRDIGLPVTHRSVTITTVSSLFSRHFTWLLSRNSGDSPRGNGNSHN